MDGVPVAKLGILLIALAASLAGCGGDSDDGGDGDGQELKVGYAFGFDVGDTADRIAFDRLAENTDFEPSIEETGGGAEAIAALTKGDIDMAKIAYGDAINAMAQGADIRMVLAGNQRLDQVLAARPDVDSLAELRGKTILLEALQPYIGLALLRQTLEEAGLEEGDYEVGSLPDSQNRAAALASARAEAAGVESVDMELSKESFNQLADLGVRLPEPSTAFVVRGDFAEQNGSVLDQVVPELLAGFESLYGPGGRDAWIEQARSEDLADHPEDVASRIYGRHRKLEYWPRGTPVTEGQHDAVVEFWVDAGVVEKAIPFEQAWDVSSWRKAAGGG
jgi:ABC-type nitrate/sulfonate/bicarbonate transport system substrate-binding protein